MPETKSTNWSTLSKWVEAVRRVESALAKENKSSKETRLSKKPMQIGVTSHSIHQVLRGGSTLDIGKKTIKENFKDEILKK